MDNSDPILYILMRSDLDSLNPGKAMVQAAHAANLMESCGDLDLIDEWKSQGDGFGTTIVLDVKTEKDLNYIISYSNLMSEVYSDIVLDKTYPITDGEVTHLLPIYTCGYIFGYKNECEKYVKNLELFP